MPEPDWHRPEDLYSEAPQKDLEIIGMGPGARKSKSYTETLHASYLLGRIRQHRRRIIETLRRLHARHYTRPVYEEDDGGNRVKVGEEPEWLTDQEILARYSAPLAWEEGHQEVVDHNPSFKGFSIKAATHLPDEERQSRRDSSAGAERQEGNAGRW